MYGFKEIIIDYIILPSTFIYSLSWEDPDVDDTVLNIDENYNVLTLTSGGCNSLNILLKNPETIDCVDIMILIIFRSASKNPSYVKYLKKYNFDIRCVYGHHDTPLLDNVNMYASFWVATKLKTEI